MGSFINTEKDRLLGTVTIGDLTWFRLYTIVQTDGSADLGKMKISLGKNSMNNSSDNPLGRRYFTDLRLEKIDSISGDTINQYNSKLRVEVEDSLWIDYKKMKTVAGVARHKRKNNNKAGRPDTTFTRSEVPLTTSIEDMIKEYNLEDLIKSQLDDQNRIQINELDAAKLQQERVKGKPNASSTIQSPQRSVTVNENNKKAPITNWDTTNVPKPTYTEEQKIEMEEKKKNYKSARDRWLEAQANKGNG